MTKTALFIDYISSTTQFLNGNNFVCAKFHNQSWADLFLEVVMILQNKILPLAVQDLGFLEEGDVLIPNGRSWVFSYYLQQNTFRRYFSHADYYSEVVYLQVTWWALGQWKGRKNCRLWQSFQTWQEPTFFRLTFFNYIYFISKMQT